MFRVALPRTSPTLVTCVPRTLDKRTTTAGRDGASGGGLGRPVGSPSAKGTLARRWPAPVDDITLVYGPLPRELPRHPSESCGRVSPRPTLNALRRARRHTREERSPTD